MGCRIGIFSVSEKRDSCSSSSGARSERACAATPKRMSREFGIGMGGLVKGRLLWSTLGVELQGWGR